MKQRMNLLQLIRDNAEKPRSWSIKQEGDEATLYVYDVIGGFWGGVSAEEVARSLDATEAKQINVRINSPGGDVFEARAIATSLRNHPAKVTAYVDGYAASAATTIAMAADRVEIATGGMFMIHNAWTIMLGNRHEMLEMAAMLEKIDQAIAADYAKKTEAEASQIADWMDAETWFSAEEAVEHGFADAVMDGESKSSNWNLSAYKNAPKPPPTDWRAQPNPAEVMSARLATFERCSA